MNFATRTKISAFVALTAALFAATPAFAELSAEELTKLARNPVGILISIAFQNNSKLNVGPDRGKLAFIGNTLFISIFFILIGFMIDRYALVRGISQDFLLAAGIIGALIAGKWIAAEACGRAFDYGMAANRRCSR